MSLSPNEPSSPESSRSASARSSPARLAAEAAAATFLLALIGAVSILVGQPLLVASLGSAAFIQLLTPSQPSARPWPMAVGQVVGVFAGFAGVYAAQAAGAPSFADHHPLVWTRILAVSVSALATAVAQLGLKAVSAAGATLALLIALGTVAPTPAVLAQLLAGVALVTLVGEGLRLSILRFS